MKKYLSELSILSHFWNVPWDSEWYFENMSSFHFLTIKNGYNRKITHKNDISQAISNFSLCYPKGPFRNVKGLMILKGISKMSFFHFLLIKNCIMGKQLSKMIYHKICQTCVFLIHFLPETFRIYIILWPWPVLNYFVSIFKIKDH